MRTGNAITERLGGSAVNNNYIIMQMLNIDLTTNYATGRRAVGGSVCVRARAGAKHREFNPHAPSGESMGTWLALPRTGVSMSIKVRCSSRELKGAVGVAPGKRAMIVREVEHGAS